MIIRCIISDFFRDFFTHNVVRLKTFGAVIFDNIRKVPGAISGGALSNTRHVNNTSSLQHSNRRNLYMKKKIVRKSWE